MKAGAGGPKSASEDYKTMQTAKEFQQAYSSYVSQKRETKTKILRLRSEYHRASTSLSKFVDAYAPAGERVLQDSALKSADANVSPLPGAQAMLELVGFLAEGFGTWVSRMEKEGGLIRKSMHFFKVSKKSAKEEIQTFCTKLEDIKNMWKRLSGTKRLVIEMITRTREPHCEDS
jgi:hypothetical protein